MTNGGWSPPGHSSEATRWRYQPSSGWIPPGASASVQDLQYQMPLDFDPADRDLGYHTLVSPPGTPAPLDAINYTPDTSEVHAHGMGAPIDKLNLSIIPSRSRVPSPSRVAAGQVGMGQSVGVGADNDYTPAGETDTLGRLLYIGPSLDGSGGADFYVKDPQTGQFVPADQSGGQQQAQQPTAQPSAPADQGQPAAPSYRGWSPEEIARRQGEQPSAQEGVSPDQMAPPNGPQYGPAVPTTGGGSPAAAAQPSALGQDPVAPPGYIIDPVTHLVIPDRTYQAPQRPPQEGPHYITHADGSVWVISQPGAQPTLVSGPDKQPAQQGTWSLVTTPSKRQVLIHSGTGEIKDPATGATIQAGRTPGAQGGVGAQLVPSVTPQGGMGGPEGSPKYSPYDATFRKYAGNLANNNEFIAIVAAATKAESGWNTKATNPNEGSTGIFQIHPIHGMDPASSQDPDKASAFMVPQFVAAYNQIKQQHPDWRGAELAAAVAATAERPAGYDDPNSDAWGNYRRAFGEVMAQGSGGQADYVAPGGTTGPAASAPGGTTDGAGDLFAPPKSYSTFKAANGKVYAINDNDPNDIVPLPGAATQTGFSQGDYRFSTDEGTGETKPVVYTPPHIQTSEFGNNLMGVDPATGEARVLSSRAGEPKIVGGDILIPPDVRLAQIGYDTKHRRERDPVYTEPTAKPGWDVTGTPSGPFTNRGPAFYPQGGSQPASSPTSVPDKGAQVGSPQVDYPAESRIFTPEDYDRNSGKDATPLPPLMGPDVDRTGMAPSQPDYLSGSGFERGPGLTDAQKNSPFFYGPGGDGGDPGFYLDPNDPRFNFVPPLVGGGQDSVPGDSRPWKVEMPVGNGRRAFAPDYRSLGVGADNQEPTMGQWFRPLGTGAGGSPQGPQYPQSRPSMSRFGGMGPGGWGPPQTSPMPGMLPQVGVGAAGWNPQIGQGAATDQVPPLDPSSIVGGGNKFGQDVSMEGMHKGTDLQAYEGTAVQSPVDGTVVGVDSDPQGLGLQIHVQSAQDGQVHTMAHLLSSDVKQGDQVRAGQPIGKVGESGAGATGPHLDYRVQSRDGLYLNPEPMLGQLGQLPPAPGTIGENGQQTGTGQGEPDGWPPGFQLPSGADPMDRSSWTEADFAAYQQALRQAPMPQGLGFDQPYSENLEADPSTPWRSAPQPGQTDWRSAPQNDMSTMQMSVPDWAQQPGGQNQPYNYHEAIDPSPWTTPGQQSTPMLGGERGMVADVADQSRPFRPVDIGGQQWNSSQSAQPSADTYFPQGQPLPPTQYTEPGNQSADMSSYDPAGQPQGAWQTQFPQQQQNSGLMQSSQFGGDEWQPHPSPDFLKPGYWADPQANELVPGGGRPVGDAPYVDDQGAFDPGNSREHRPATPLQQNFSLPPEAQQYMAALAAASAGGQALAGQLGGRLAGAAGGLAGMLPRNLFDPEQMYGPQGEVGQGSDRGSFDSWLAKQQSHHRALGVGQGPHAHVGLGADFQPTWGPPGGYVGVGADDDPSTPDDAEPPPDEWTENPPVDWGNTGAGDPPPDTGGSDPWGGIFDPTAGGGGTAPDYSPPPQEPPTYAPNPGGVDTGAGTPGAGLPTGTHNQPGTSNAPTWETLDAATQSMFTQAYQSWAKQRWQWERDGKPGGEAAWQALVGNPASGGTRTSPGQPGAVTPAPKIDPKTGKPVVEPADPLDPNNPPAPTYTDKVTAYQQAYLDSLGNRLDFDKKAEDNRHNEAMRTATTAEGQQKEVKRHNKAVEDFQNRQLEVNKINDELNRENALRMQGSFAQQQQAGFLKTALTNPWLQSLTGMAPQFGTPGWDPNQKGVLSQILNGWEPQANVLQPYANPSNYGQPAQGGPPQNPGQTIPYVPQPDAGAPGAPGDVPVGDTPGAPGGAPGQTPGGAPTSGTTPTIPTTNRNGKPLAPTQAKRLARKAALGVPVSSPAPTPAQQIAGTTTSTNRNGKTLAPTAAKRAAKKAAGVVAPASPASPASPTPTPRDTTGTGTIKIPKVIAKASKAAGGMTKKQMKNQIKKQQKLAAGVGQGWNPAA